MQREKNVNAHVEGQLFRGAFMSPTDASLLPLVARIVSAQVSHNETLAQALPGLIRCVYQALANAGAMAAASQPASGVAARGQTVFDDHLICLDCGLHVKMLKRHLRSVHNATPVQYRLKWDLPADYPMVARFYAALRSDLAKSSGLGKWGGSRGA
jgi:predicted transcriptional regulator